MELSNENILSILKFITNNLFFFEEIFTLYCVSETNIYKNLQ